MPCDFPVSNALMLCCVTGCGKSLLANAIAGELDVPMLKLAATEIVSGVSGESEEKLRDMFEIAVSSSPCVIFIGEWQFSPVKSTVLTLFPVIADRG